MLAEQFHIQKLGRLVVDGPLRSAGRGFGVQRNKIVIHGHRVGVHPPAAQFLGNFHSCGGLTRARGPGQQHNGTVLQIGQDPVRRQGYPLGIAGVALRQKFLHIAPDAPIDLLQLVGHEYSSSVSIYARADAQRAPVGGLIAFYS